MMIDQTPHDDDAPKQRLISDHVGRLTDFAEAHDNENGHCFALIRELLCYTMEGRRELIDALTYEAYLADVWPIEVVNTYSTLADDIPTEAEFDFIHTTLIEALDDEWSDDAVSHLAMSLSLCPIHFCDWASCFDDDNPECAQVRYLFPHSHDT